jgi:prevent-host-death family protein
VGCTDEKTGRQLASQCPHLAEPGHGSWYYAVQVTTVGGWKARYRRGGFATREAGLIFRYHACMRTMTATEASRHFSDLLDAVERGETVTILRGSHPIAEIGPAHRRTGADLRTALEGTPPPDEAFTRDISAALAMVTSEVPDPWSGA